MYSGKKAQHDFPKMRGGGDQRPFGTFPKIHPFWKSRPSLRTKRQRLKRPALVNLVENLSIAVSDGHADFFEMRIHPHGFYAEKPQICAYICGFSAYIVKNNNKNCECCPRHSLFKGHNVIVNI